jgi:hypothetical protein
VNQEIKERENELTNNAAETTSKTNFWRNEIMWRTTNSGINANVTSQYAPYIDKYKIVADIKKKNAPYTDGRKYIPKDKNERNTYFVNLVNEALSDIWHGKKGFCYNTEQLKEIIKICPDVKVRYDGDDGCWYCRLV